MKLDVSIQPRTSRGGFYTGDTITGSVKILNTQQILFSYIKLSLIGHSTTSTSSYQSKRSARPKTVHEKHVFYKHTTLIAPKDSSQRSLLDIGDHEYEFEICLPLQSRCATCQKQLTLPASFSPLNGTETDPYATIEYTLQVDIKLPSLIRSTKSFKAPVNVSSGEKSEVLQMESRVMSHFTTVNINKTFDAPVEKRQSTLASWVFGERKPTPPAKNSINIPIWIELRSNGFIQRQHSPMNLRVFIITPNKGENLNGLGNFFYSDIEVELVSIITGIVRNQPIKKERKTPLLTDNTRKKRHIDLGDAVRYTGEDSRARGLYEIELLTDKSSLSYVTCDLEEPNISTCSFKLEHGYFVTLKLWGELAAGDQGKEELIAVPITVAPPKRLISGQLLPSMRPGEEKQTSRLPSYTEATGQI